MTPPYCTSSSTPAPRSSAWSARPGSTRHGKVRTDLDEGGDGAGLRRVPPWPGPPRLLRRRALLRRVRERSRIRDGRARRRRGGRRRAARALRHQRGDAAVRRRRGRARRAGRGERAARHPRAQRRRLRRRELARAVDAGVLQVQGTATATASAPATPISCRSPPTWCSRWGPPTRFRRARSNTSPSSRTTSLRSRTSRRRRGSRTRTVSRSPAGGPAHERRGARLARVRARAAESVGHRRGVVASDYSGGASIRMKAEESAWPSTTPRSRRPSTSSGARVGGIHLRPGRGVARAAAAPRRRWAQEYFWIESYRVHVEERVGDGESRLRRGDGRR